MFDLLIRNGVVVDGTGAPRFRADVAVSGEAIAAVAPGGIPADQARDVIDAAGLCVAPGFVDMHAHSDLLLLVEPDIPCKVRQGFVAEHLGQDGISVAPVRPDARERTRRRVNGLLGRWEELVWDWESVGDFLARLERAAPATCPAYPVPHGTLRAYVIGPEARPATADELRAMQAALEACLDQGAIGMTTGLIYPPCTYADRAELVALLSVLARRGSFFSIHLRSEGAATLQALEEILSIGRETGCSINLSHLKIAGRENWHVLDRFVSIIEAYREHVDVTFDQYPYTAGSTLLDATLPPWAHDGGAEATLARLRDTAARARIHAAITDRTDSSWENFLWLSGPEQLFVSAVATAANQDLVGSSFTEIAARRATDPITAIMDLLLEEDLSVTIVSHSQSEAIVETFLRLPYGMFCTDGIVGKKPHPRLYGTAPRVLGRYVRERGILSLEEAVRRLSSAAWARLGKKGEGRIEPGRGASLVVFDPDLVADTATYEQPVSYPQGLPHVIVRGRVTVRDGDPTGLRGGKVLRPDG